MGEGPSLLPTGRGEGSARSAYREAVAFYEQALEALQHLPERRDTREQAIDLRMAIGAALWPLGNYEQRPRIPMPS